MIQVNSKRDISLRDRMNSWVRSRYDGGFTRDETVFQALSPRKGNTTLIEHIFRDVRDPNIKNMFLECVAEVYLNGDPDRKRVNDLRGVTSPRNGKKGGRPPQPLAADVAYEFVCECNLFDNLRRWRQEWFRYSKNGWQPIHNDDLISDLTQWLATHQVYRNFASNNFINNILTHLKAAHRCAIKSDVSMPAFLSRSNEGTINGKAAPNWVAFDGKAIDVVEYAKYLAGLRDEPPRSLAVSHEFFSRDILPVPWNPNAIEEKKCERFFKFLDRVLPDEEQRVQLQRMFGLCLSDEVRYEVLFYLYGPSARNGKTTALNILSAILGKHNVANINLGLLAGKERFQLFPLTISKVNISGDMQTEVRYGELGKIEGVLKDCVSGGMIDAERKHKDKTFFPCKSRFICAGNALPSFVDKSDGIWERLRIIEFPVQIPFDERDPNLAKDIIKNELPGVVQWALWGLADIITNNAVPETDRGNEIKEDHRRHCDHERLFLSERGYKSDDKSWIKPDEIYCDYKEWMISNGYRGMSKGNFNRRVEALLKVEIGTVRDDAGDYLRAWKGVKREDDLTTFVTDVTATSIAPRVT
jgi:P4 family phage/plasmid primase-like protien